ncbi:MAG: hypothetical protein AAFW68_09150 [Pseudomonadota bacterium]
MLSRGKGLIAASATAVLFFSGGCAVNPLTTSQNTQSESVAERDMLADAAQAVQTAPWPRIDQVSFLSRLAGAENDNRITRKDAIAIYLEDLGPGDARFSRLATDARANLGAANRLLTAADHALTAQRVNMNDIAMVETAIQALRTNRQIYVSAAREIEKTGEPVDKNQLTAIRDAYADAIRALGKSADALAERIEEDHSATYAAPTRQPRSNLSGV